MEIQLQTNRLKEEIGQIRLLAGEIRISVPSGLVGEQLAVGAEFLRTYRDFAKALCSYEKLLDHDLTAAISALDQMEAADQNAATQMQ